MSCYAVNEVVTVSDVMQQSHGEFVIHRIPITQYQFHSLLPLSDSPFSSFLISGMIPSDMCIVGLCNLSVF